MHPSSTSLLQLPTAAFLTQPATLIGFIALAAACTSPLLRQRKAILGVQVLASVLFGIHYALLGSPTAAAMCGMGALQGLSLVLLANWRLRVGIVWASVAVSLVVTALTWRGMPSLLSQVGQILSATGRLQLDTRRLRLCFLASVSFWITHDLIVGTPFGLASNTLSLATLVVGLWRDHHPSRARKIQTATA